MLTVHSLPELRQPILLCAFSGWPDAGTSASGALAYLAMKWRTRRIAEFDADSLYTYTITRPATGLEADGRRQLHWPELAFWSLALPEAPRDVVLLRGPEPDLLWRRCASAIVDLCRRLAVEQVLTLGCFGAAVAHSAPTPLFARTSDPELRHRLERLGLQDTAYQGPTAFTTALVDQAAAAGLPGGGLWAGAPVYLQGAANPKVSAALLSVVEQLSGVTLGLDELQTAARDMEQRVDRAFRERPDLRRLVREMQEDEPEETDAAEEPTSPAEALPSAQAVLEDLENYLRELQQRDEHPEQRERQQDD